MKFGSSSRTTDSAINNKLQMHSMSESSNGLAYVDSHHKNHVFLTVSDKSKVECDIIETQMKRNENMFVGSSKQICLVVCLILFILVFTFIHSYGYSSFSLTIKNVMHLLHSSSFIDVNADCKNLLKTDFADNTKQLTNGKNMNKDLSVIFDTLHNNIPMTFIHINDGEINVMEKNGCARNECGEGKLLSQGMKEVIAMHLPNLFVGLPDPNEWKSAANKAFSLRDTTIYKHTTATVFINERYTQSMK